MVFLLNRERVLTEMAELSRLHISGLLSVDPSAVTASFELRPEDSTVVPEFNVSTPTSGALEVEYVKQAIAEVWNGWAKQELIDRLNGLAEMRVQ